MFLQKLKINCMQSLKIANKNRIKILCFFFNIKLIYLSIKILTKEGNALRVVYERMAAII